ncbi:uncharacterized protein BT62DRAFT_998456 [Guyanagaster necrorhizus]|uniref:Uncharacterized protein n=1 Tax=Guyanagaster necrorhizus TaxID=856835 RepID=A0A9P8AYE7_9AGAR|nr:uncharacterized protein BT62DRAFT_998456 [Guyanagaster necrorhizus MCA 3950]KAG7452420.1 hypothetical protein BT62DRAFT_998456 [Guyanagaster necrorhizus MCA 3950]
MFPQPHALLALALFFRPFFVSQTEAKSLTPSGNQYYCCQALWTEDQKIFGQECVQHSCDSVHELCCNSIVELHSIRSHCSVQALTSIPIPSTTYYTGSEYDSSSL